MSISPQNEAEVAEAIATRKAPLWIAGGGTRLVPPAGIDILATSGLRGITLYEPGALTMVAKAGTPLPEIEAALAAEGQMLAFEPSSFAAITGAAGPSTIGGVFATNSSGSRRVQAGAARDFLLGVRFVDGAGTVLSNGGRVMKNVTGYDLVKLMAGAHGTLGVVTEVAFKVLPKPEAQAQIEIAGLSDQDAIRALATAVGSPYDVTGASHSPDSIAKGGRTAVRIEGFADSVTYRAEKLRALLGTFGEARITDGNTDWDALRNMTAFAPETRGEGGTLWRLSVKPSDGPEVMRGIAAAHDVIYQYDHGGGRIWVWAQGADIPVLHTDLSTAAGRAGGHSTRIHSQTHANLPRFQPQPAPIAQLSAALRAGFDPHGIFNPGLMG